VTPREGVEQESLEVLAEEISDAVRIRLEYEATYGGSRSFRSGTAVRGR